MKTAAALPIALLLLLGAAGCGREHLASSTSVSEDRTATVLSRPLSASYDSEDEDATWDLSKATSINLAGSSATVDGPGVALDGSEITIAVGGTYVISGSLADGRQELIRTTRKR